mmetsp:Transcript_54502/g.137589  ORF Transcript_54502/g.137589 Transcript_54502/m.137589 type:complete len:346 (+) Transcript_54502:99-1136(+)
MGDKAEEKAKSWEVTGLALTAFGVQFSVFSNSLMKTINTVPVLQAMQVRFLIQWCFTASAGLCLQRRGHQVHLLGKPETRVLLLGRAAFFATAILSLWTALRMMPVGDATTIVYLYPVICGLLANRFLAESLGWQFWAQAATCCVGVLLVTGLGFSGAGEGSYDTGAALALVAAFGFASTNCCVRALKDVQTIEIQLFTDSLMAFVAMPCTLLLTGNAMDWTGWHSGVLLRLAGATMFGLTALLIVILGHQLAPASKATLFTYLEVPSAFLVQMLAFGEVPGPQKACGAALILAAGLHRFLAEAAKAPAAASKVDARPLLTTEDEKEEQTHLDVHAKLPDQAVGV